MGIVVVTGAMGRGTCPAAVSRHSDHQDGVGAAQYEIMATPTTATSACHALVVTADPIRGICVYCSDRLRPTWPSSSPPSKVFRKHADDAAPPRTMPSTPTKCRQPRPPDSAIIRCRETYEPVGTSVGAPTRLTQPRGVMRPPERRRARTQPTERRPARRTRATAARLPRPII